MSATAAAIIGAIGLATSIGGGAIGSAKARREAREQRRALERLKGDEEAWYNKEYYTDELDRTSAKNMIRRVEQTLSRQANQARGAAAVSGATPGAVLGAQANAQETLSDTMGNIAAQESARKSAINETHQQNVSNLAAGNMSISTQSQAAGSQLAANSAQVGASSLSMLGDAFDAYKASKADKATS